MLLPDEAPKRAPNIFLLNFQSYSLPKLQIRKIGKFYVQNLFFFKKKIPFFSFKSSKQSILMVSFSIFEQYFMAFPYPIPSLENYLYPPPWAIFYYPPPSRKKLDPPPSTFDLAQVWKEPLPPVDGVWGRSVGPKLGLPRAGIEPRPSACDADVYTQVIP